MPRKKIVKDKSKRSESEILVDVYNLEGKVIKKMNVSKKVFGVKINPRLFAQVVRTYLANKRSGTHDTKTRSEVSGSTRKIYRQKGTGRARHGDIKAPIFIGGGVAHGPKPRDYSLELPMKMRRLALCGALSDKLEQGTLKIVTDISDIAPKTKVMLKILNNLGLKENQNKFADTILVIPKMDTNIYLSGRNIENFKLTTPLLLNAYEVMKSINLIFVKEAILRLEERLVSHKAETEMVAGSKAISSEDKVKKLRKKKKLAN